MSGLNLSKVRPLLDFNKWEIEITSHMDHNALSWGLMGDKFRSRILLLGLGLGLWGTGGLEIQQWIQPGCVPNWVLHMEAVDWVFLQEKMVVFGMIKWALWTVSR